VVRAGQQLTMLTVASLRQQATDGALLVGTLDRIVAGTARVRPAGDGGWVQVNVAPEYRRRGVGRALLAAAEAEAVGGVLRTIVHDDPESRGFAERRGYVPRRSFSLRRLDLPTFAVPQPRPVPGVELRTGRDFADDPRAVFAIEAEAALDIPGYDEGGPAYESWLARTWNAPDADHDLTTVATVDGEPAAYTAVLSDRERVYWSAMTGTRRAYRGRGLARLVKVASLHRARAAGLTVAVAGNDDENAPIIAVNDRLGYRPAVTLWRYDKR
jgi:GNAT superfamily N-acetyltransferase